MRDCGPASACVSAVLAVAAAAAAGDTQQVKLRFETGRRVTGLYTPTKVLTLGQSVSINSDHGKIPLFGRQLDFAGLYVLDGYRLALDCNGDGKASASEWAGVDLLKRAVSFRLRLLVAGARRDFAVRFVDVRVGVQRNRVINVHARAVNEGCMSGAFNDCPIRLFDDDLDGKYTQDGKDAVAIGAAPGAMPLRRIHQIGPRYYRLTVAEDGSTVGFEPLDDVQLGLVEVPIRRSLLRCLMLTDEQGGHSVDLLASGRTGVPAGSYRLSYAVLAAGKRLVVAGPTDRALTYPVAANHINVLRMGPPVTLTFPVTYHQRDQKVYVGTPIRIHGVGGEIYHLRLAGYRPFGDPLIRFMRGRTVQSNGHMVYDHEERLLIYGEWAPKGMTHVVMMADLPVLGRAVGAHAIKDVLDGKRTAEPPAPKQPAVATRKLPAGVKLGSQAPAPKPAPPRPQPKPTPPAPRPKPTPPPATRPVRPKRTTIDREATAQTILDMAVAFLRQGKKDKGIAKLKEVVEKYPNTDAAKRAADRLLDIELEAEDK